MRRRSVGLVLATLLTFPACVWACAWACPFCPTPQQTICEEIVASDVAVIAEQLPKPDKSAAESKLPSDRFADQAKAKFKIIEVLKGKEHLKGATEISVLYFGQAQPGTKFLIMGVEPGNLNWSTPITVSKRSLAYIRELQKLPEKGVERLQFFQEYLEDPEDMLARDAYDEFARADYEVVQGLKPHMNRQKLLAWINDGQIPASRRRLYLTMLGVCGTQADVPALAEMIKSDSRQAKFVLDALIACYLMLKGPDGVSLVEDRFLANPKAEYTDIYSTIMALRFHGEQAEVIKRDRLLTAMKHMLDRPQLADLVIPDLARWEDWSARERLVKLFKDSDKESSWVRVPVLQYLRTCPLPEAKQDLEELAKIDPDAMRRASSFFPYTGRAKPKQPGDNAGAPDESSTVPPAESSPSPGIGNPDLE